MSQTCDEREKWESLSIADMVNTYCTKTKPTTLALFSSIFQKNVTKQPNTEETIIAKDVVDSLVQSLQFYNNKTTTYDMALSMIVDSLQREKEVDAAAQKKKTRKPRQNIKKRY